MQVCRELKMTLAEGLERISVFELKMWASFFKIEAEQTKEQMKKYGRHRNN